MTAKRASTKRLTEDELERLGYVVRVAMHKPTDAVVREFLARVQKPILDYRIFCRDEGEFTRTADLKHDVGQMRQAVKALHRSTEGYPEILGMLWELSQERGFKLLPFGAELIHFDSILAEAERKLKGRRGTKAGRIRRLVFGVAIEYYGTFLVEPTTTRDGPFAEIANAALAIATSPKQERKIKQEVLRDALSQWRTFMAAMQLTILEAELESTAKRASDEGPFRPPK